MRSKELYKEIQFNDAQIKHMMSVISSVENILREPCCTYSYNGLIEHVARTDCGYIYAHYYGHGEYGWRPQSGCCLDLAERVIHQYEKHGRSKFIVSDSRAKELSDILDTEVSEYRLTRETKVSTDLFTIIFAAAVIGICFAFVSVLTFLK